MKAQILDVLPSLAFSGLMAAGMTLLGNASQLAASLIILCVEAVCGVLFYLLANLAIKSEALHEILAMRKLMPSFKTGGTRK